MNWIAFFSQTGSEIVNLSRELGRKPDLLVTNNTSEEKYKFNPGIRDLNVVIMSSHHDNLMTYLNNQTLYSPSDTLITLHGYLRILPESVCNRYEIYNGHPGAIKLYPELKGKDPQERTWKDRHLYPIIGSVVHKVIPDVDNGHIVSEIYSQNDIISLNDMYEALKSTSFKAWMSFLKEKFDETRDSGRAVSR